MRKFNMIFVLSLLFLCIVLFTKREYQMLVNVYLTNKELHDIVHQIVIRDESRICDCDSDELTFCRYTTLRYFPQNEKKTLDLCSILKDEKIICNESCSTCDIYIAEINVLNKKKLTVKVITNTVTIFYFCKQNGKWELYKIVTRIIMDHPIIKIKKDGKWHILTS